MGNLQKTHIIEAASWIAIIAILYAFSFEFDKEIEIYKFGASGWPRSILALFCLVVVGNIWYQYNHGSMIQAGRVGISDDDISEADRSLSSWITISAFITAPLLYAWSLKPIGFYSATPFFILAIIMLLGERRPKWIVGITSLIYGILITLFLLILNAPLPQGTVSPFYDFSAFMLRISNQIQHLF